MSATRAPNRIRTRPWTLRQWLLAGFFIVVGAVAWWQLQGLRPADTEKKQHSSEPDYIVRNFTAVETNAAGKPDRTLTATTLDQYVDARLSRLEQPRMVIYQEKGPPWHARANQGLVLDNGEEIRLFGDVHLDREATDEDPPTHIETEFLRIWHERAYAETDMPVRISRGQDWLTSKGMQLWYNDPTHATFHGRTHMLLTPGAEEQP